MSIRNYNAFLKAVRREHGITHKQAQRAYRRVSSNLGRPAIGRDVARHPRITKAAIRQNKRTAETKRAGKARTGEKKTIRSIAEWRRYHQTQGGDSVRIVSSADYGRGKRGRR